MKKVPLKPKKYYHSVKISGTIPTDRFEKAAEERKKNAMKVSTSFAELLDSRIREYLINEIMGPKEVVGEIGEWRLTRQHLKYPSLLYDSEPPMKGRISIEHKCGDEKEPWQWAFTPDLDKRRKLCINCKTRVPENIKGLAKLVE